MKRSYLGLAVATLAGMSLTAQANPTYEFHLPILGMKKAAPTYDGDAFVFRHVRHAEEGWADIVIAPVTTDQVITDEVTYRLAAQNAGLEGYFTQITSWRCDQQDFGPDVVPEVEAGCGGTGDVGYHNYVLAEVPQDVNQPVVFARRAADREYGIYGNGHWATTCPLDPEDLEIGVTTLEPIYQGQLSSSCHFTYDPTLSLSAGDWIMGTNPATHRR